MKHLIAAFILITCCIGCTYKGKKEVLLRLKFHKYQKIDIKFRQYIVADDQPERPVSNEYIRLGLKVDSLISDSLFMMSVKYDYYRAEGNGIMSGIDNYSSDRDEASMDPRERSIHQRIKPFLDTTYTYMINNRGTLVRPFAFKNGSDVPVKLLLFDYDLYQIEFPKDSLSVGDNWKNQSDLNIGGVKRQLEYYIAAIYQQTIEIKMTGKFTMATGEVNNYKGYYYLDRESNKLDSMKIEAIGKTFFHGKAKSVISINAR